MSELSEYDQKYSPNQLGDQNLYPISSQLSETSINLVGDSQESDKRQNSLPLSTTMDINNKERENIKCLSYMFFGLLFAFFIFAIWSYSNISTLLDQNKILMKELEEKEYLFNNHVDNSISFLENITDYLKKLKFPSNKRPPVIYSYL